MPLPGELAQQIHSALLQAFPSRGALRQLVRFRLDENLDSLTGEGTLTETVFELIAWAEAHGQLEALLAQASEEVPGNQALKESYEALQAYHRQAGEEAGSTRSESVASAPATPGLSRLSLPLALVLLFVVVAGAWSLYNLFGPETGTAGEENGLPVELTDEAGVALVSPTATPTSTPAPTGTPTPTITPTVRPTLEATPGWSSINTVGLDDEVLALAVDEDIVYVGGRFRSPFKGVAAWDHRAGSWLQIGAGVDGSVHALAIYQGDLIVGGRFAAVDEDGERFSNLARWDGRAWHRLGDAIFGDEVLALLADGENLFIGGSFGMTIRDEEGNAQSVRGIISWDGTRYHALGTGDRTGVGKHGGNDCTDADRVMSIVRHGDYLYIGGRFPHIQLANNGELDFSLNFARFHLEANEWEGIGRVGNNVCQRVHALGVYEDEIYVGGDFRYITTEEGNQPNPQLLARWNPETERWGALTGIDYRGTTRGNSTPTIGRIDSFVVGEKGLYIGGRFIRAGGNRNLNIVRFDRGVWESLAGGVSGESENTTHIFALARQDDQIIVGGDFAAAGEVPAPYIAIWGED